MPRPNFVSGTGFACAAPLLVHELLAKKDPARYFVPPYVGARGWIGVRIDGRPSWRMVEALVRDAFRHVAPPRFLRRDRAPRIPRPHQGGVISG